MMSQSITVYLKCKADCMFNRNGYCSDFFKSAVIGDNGKCEGLRKNE